MNVRDNETRQQRSSTPYSPPRSPSSTSMPSTPQSSRGNTPHRSVSLSSTPVSPVLDNDVVDLTSLPSQVSTQPSLPLSPPTDLASQLLHPSICSPPVAPHSSISACYLLLRTPPSQHLVPPCRPTLKHLRLFTFSLLRTPPSQHLVPPCHPTLMYLSPLTFSLLRTPPPSILFPPVTPHSSISPHCPLSSQDSSIPASCSPCRHTLKHLCPLTHSLLRTPPSQHLLSPCRPMVSSSHFFCKASPVMTGTGGA